MHKASGNWRVVVPARWSGTGKRHHRYFDTKGAAERFIADTLTEREAYGRQAITDSERHWLGYLKERISNLELLPEIVNFWKRSGEHFEPIGAADAVTGIALTAQYAGNSENTIRKHYLRALRREQGNKWFQVTNLVEEHARLWREHAKLRPDWEREMKEWEWEQAHPDEPLDDEDYDPDAPVKW
jgi:hypothetical protein